VRRVALDAPARDVRAARDLQDLCVRRAIGRKLPASAAGNLWRDDPGDRAACGIARRAEGEGGPQRGAGVMTVIDTQAQANGAAILSVRGLVKSFGGLKAINDVSFEAKAHAVTALIGPNGAGKTTVFNLVTNIMPRDAGRVTFAGRDLEN